MQRPGAIFKRISGPSVGLKRYCYMGGSGRCNPARPCAESAKSSNTQCRIVRSTTEQEADRGPQAGSPRGVVDATWPSGQTQIGVFA
jgi:hypothetical protein